MAHTRIKAHNRSNFGEVAFHFDKSMDKPLENLEKGNNPTKADETENEKNELFILDSADYWFLVFFHILHLLRVNSSSVERCFPFLWEGGFHRF